MESVCGTIRLSWANLENNKMDQFFKSPLKDVVDLTAVVEALVGRNKYTVPVQQNLSVILQSILG